MPRPSRNTMAVAAMAVYAVVAGIVLATALRGGSGALAGSLAGGSGGGGPAVTVYAASGTLEFVVERGMSASEIADALLSAGVIADAQQFEILLDLTGDAAGLRAGCYAFRGPTPAAEVIRRLLATRSDERLVVIPEGLRLEEIGALLEREGMATEAEWEVALATPPRGDVIDARPGGASLLGYLLPASYPVGCGGAAGASGLVAAMALALEEQFDGEAGAGLRQEAAAAGLSLHEVLTLASIVEKEAVLRDEMPLIASVFIERLSLGMALQADPTVQFAIASRDGGRDGWWPALALTDKEFDSPYNTYVYPGLPPGPIAGPGIDAIRAVVRPAESDYLYFVATCDGTNRHAFAETLDGHIANVVVCHGQ